MSEFQKPKKEKRLSDMDKPLIYDQSLMEIFGFDEQALRTNDGGFVTNRQKQMISEELQEEADSMWLMLTIFLGTAVLLAIIFSMQGYAPLPLVIGAGLVIGGMMLGTYFRQTRLKKDSDRLRAIRVEGMPQIKNSFTRDSQAVLEIADQKLPMTYQQAAALNEFALPMLRVYYAANSKQVLSAEVLDTVHVDKLKNEDLIDDDDEMVVIARQLDDEQSVMRK